MSVEFDGANNTIGCGAASTITNQFFGAGATLMAWIYPEGWGEGGFGRIVNKSTVDGDSGWAFYISELDTTDSNLESFGFSYSSIPPTADRTSAAAPDNTITLNNWHHCVVAFDADAISNRPVFYHNGGLVTTETKMTGGGSYNSDTTFNFRIAGRGTPTTDREFDGLIEDVRFYNRILSAGEISTIYNAKGHDNIINGLIGRWPLWDQGNGVAVSGTSAVKDISGNNNHGTPQGSPDPIFRPGILAPRRRYL